MPPVLDETIKPSLEEPELGAAALLAEAAVDLDGKAALLQLAAAPERMAQAVALRPGPVLHLAPGRLADFADLRGWDAVQIHRLTEEPHRAFPKLWVGAGSQLCADLDEQFRCGHSFARQPWDFERSIQRIPSFLAA